ncbi:MAG: aldo/keto reductase [Candidatus Hydrogenedentes bacterium]|nr:aldo/keto reductase [Candidatus Hydrogenedentota bacterium]
MSKPVDRRDFLRTTTIAAATAGLASLRSESQSPNAQATAATPLPTRELGKTGQRVSILGLGGEHTLSKEGTDAEAEAIIARALELGVTYFDTAQLYYPSEKYLGQGLKGRRDTVFLSTKIDPRDPEEAKPLIERSLTLLGTAQVDNLNIHRVRNLEDVDRITKKGGLLDLVHKMKDEGVCRHIGISGHYTAEALIALMRRGDFTFVLLPVNPTDTHMSPFESARREARSRGMGVIAMKVAARGRFFKECGVARMDGLLTYALSQDVDVAIVGAETVAHVEDNVRIAKSFQPMSTEAQHKLEEEMKPHTSIGNFYKPGGAGWLD